MSPNKNHVQLHPVNGLYDFRLADVSIDTLVAVLEAVASHKTDDVLQVANFAGLARSTVSRALLTLQSLRLVDKDEANSYFCCVPQVRRGMSNSEIRFYLRKALISYRPFEAVCEGLALNESLSVAIRKASVLLEINDEGEERFNILMKWGRDLGVLTQENGDVGLTIDIGTIESSAETSIITNEDIESEVKARLYISLKLGRELYNILAENERLLLAQAVLKFASDPDDAIEKSGQALENFLREAATAKGLRQEASKLNGSSQLGNLLASQGLIHSHHQKTIDAVSMFRNAKVHNKDKKTLTPWELTPLASFSSVLGVLLTLKSLHEYMQNGRQIL